MFGTVVIVILVVGIAVGGYFIYKKHKATIDREAARIADQAQDLADKVKKQ